jgi:hypothetical protein
MPAEGSLTSVDAAATESRCLLRLRSLYARLSSDPGPGDAGFWVEWEARQNPAIRIAADFEAVCASLDAYGLLTKVGDVVEALNVVDGLTG